MSLIYEFDFGPAAAGLEAVVTDTYTAVEVDGSPLTLDAAGQGQMELPEGSYQAVVDGERHMVISGVLNVESSLGSGGDLFSLAAREWLGAPFSGPPEAVSGAVDAGPEFGWTLAEYDEGSSDSDYQQNRVLSFDEPGIYSVALSMQITTASDSAGVGPKTAKVTIMSDQSSAGYSQVQQGNAIYEVNEVGGVSTELTFAIADPEDTFILRCTAERGGLLTGATTYLTIVKLAPYA